MRKAVLRIMENPRILGERVKERGVKIIPVAKEGELLEVKEIQEELQKFSRKVEEVFPSKAKTALAKLPLVGSLIEQALIKGIVKKFATVAEELNAVEARLSKVREELFKSQTLLARQAEEIKEFIKTTEEAVRIGEEAKKEFEEEFKKMGWDGSSSVARFFSQLEKKVDGEKLGEILEKRAKYETLLSQLSRLYQLLAHLKQTLLSAYQMRKTNELIFDRLETLSTVGVSSIALQLAVRGEAFRQKRALELIEATDAFLEELTLKNAQTVKENAQLAGELRKKPIVAVETLKQSLNLILEGFEEQKKNEKELADALRQMIKELEELGRETEAVLKKVEKPVSKEKK